MQNQLSRALKKKTQTLRHLPSWIVSQNCQNFLSQSAHWTTKAHTVVATQGSDAFSAQKHFPSDNILLLLSYTEYIFGIRNV